MLELEQSMHGILCLRHAPFCVGEALFRHQLTGYVLRMSRDEGGVRTRDGVRALAGAGPDGHAGAPAVHRCRTLVTPFHCLARAEEDAPRVAAWKIRGGQVMTVF